MLIEFTCVWLIYLCTEHQTHCKHDQTDEEVDDRLHPSFEEPGPSVHEGCTDGLHEYKLKNGELQKQTIWNKNDF